MFSLYKKELQSYYYSPFAYVIAALFLLVFSITFVVGISDLSGTQYKFSFPNVFYNHFFYFIFLIPALTMRTFADERKCGTEVLLISSPLNVFQIVIAKFLAVTTVFFMMLVLFSVINNRNRRRGYVVKSYLRIPWIFSLGISLHCNRNAYVFLYRKPHYSRYTRRRSNDSADFYR